MTLKCDFKKTNLKKTFFLNWYTAVTMSAATADIQCQG